MRHGSSVLFTLALLALLTFSGCGGSSSKSTGPTEQHPAEAPVLRGWRAVRNVTTLVVGFDAFDAQGDMFGGFVDISGTVNGHAFTDRVVINQLLPGRPANDPELDLFIVFKAPPGYYIRSGVPITFSATATDRGGHTSNAISGAFLTETPMGQSEDGPLATTVIVTGQAGTQR